MYKRQAFDSTNFSRKVLERPAIVGDSPVGERVGTVLRKREVERDTWNPVRRRGDHPPRLNTRDRPIVCLLYTSHEFIGDVYSVVQIESS